MFGLVLFLAAGVIAFAGLVRDGHMQDAPTASECVDDWDARIGGSEQRVVGDAPPLDGRGARAVAGVESGWRLILDP